MTCIHQLTEFGCLNPSFPDGQRDFRQVDLLFTPAYREQFVGGVVFEYNTELINSLATYPFSGYAPGNFGLGYFTPEDCDDINTNCSYVPFPQYHTLSEKYLAVDVSDEPLLSEVSEEALSPPECPDLFDPLINFDWPSAALADRSCPGPVYVTCPAVPDECTGLGVPYQAQPTDAPQPTEAPTLAPTTETQFPTTSEPPPTEETVEVETMPPVGAPSISTMPPSLGDSSAPRVLRGSRICCWLGLGLFLSIAWTF